MGILILNNAGEQLTIQDLFITDASRGSGYYGAIKYILPPNGHRVLSNSIFTRQTWNELKPLEVHIKVNGKTHLVLHHDDFEKNQEMTFGIDRDKKLVVNVVPKVVSRGLAPRIWAMIPSCGPGAKIEALVAAAKPRIQIWGIEDGQKTSITPKGEMHHLLNKELSIDIDYVAINSRYVNTSFLALYKLSSKYNGGTISAPGMINHSSALGSQFLVAVGGQPAAGVSF